MNVYSSYINALYDLLSDYQQNFIGIDEVLEEVPSGFVIRPSFTFGQSSQLTNLREIEDDVLVTLQIFKAHNDQSDIVEIADDIREKINDEAIFKIDDYYFSVNRINLVKSFDSKYTSVSVVIYLVKCGKIVEEEPIDWTTRPLTFVAASPNTKIIFRRFGTGNISTSIKYKFNIDDAWQSYTPGDDITLEKVGDIVMFENTSSAKFCYDSMNYFRIESVGSFYARGQVYSLTNYSQPGTWAFHKLFENNDGILSTPLFPSSGNGSSYAFNLMFSGCANLKEAEDINFDTMTGDNVCASMFQDCISLVKAPKIKATTLGPGCLNAMFQNCVSLVEASELPAPYATTNVYRAMFQNCYSLQKAPELPASGVNQYAYYQMFQNCVNLKEAPSVLPVTTISAYCYGAMFWGCKKLKKAPQLMSTNAPNYACQNMFYNCTSLEEAPSALLANTVDLGGYDGMFQGCTSLTKAPQIHATSVGQYGMRNMFYGDTSLTEGPEILPSSITGANAFDAMFRGCTKLVEAPELPATTLQASCYANMFYGCTSLIKAPELLATTLVNYCYNSMFYNCSSLNEIKVHFLTWTGNSTLNWVSGVQTVSGTFICPASLPNERGTSRIPVNWTKVDI